MEVIVQILILFILTNCIIKLSFWKLPFIVVFIVLIAIFILFSTKYAVTESKIQFLECLNNEQLMKNIAVLVTVEALLSLSFCFMSLQSSLSRFKRYIAILLRGFASLLIFPALYYTLAKLMFLFSGIDFWRISLFFTLVIVSFMFLFSIGFKYLIKKRESKLELHFIISLFIACLGLLMTVNNRIVISSPTMESIVSTNFNFLYPLICVGVFFIIGAIWEKIKWRFRNRI